MSISWIAIHAADLSVNYRFPLQFTHHINITTREVPEKWLKPRSCIYPIGNSLCLQEKYTPGPINHSHIWQVSPRLNCGDTYLIWTYYFKDKSCDDDNERTEGNWFGELHTRSVEFITNQLMDAGHVMIFHPFTLNVFLRKQLAWMISRRHDMKTFSVLLAVFEWNTPADGDS